jgi:hypothetical protein
LGGHALEDRRIFRAIAILSVVAFCFFHTPAFAHERWATGGAVPSWVGASCCGPADAHHLESDQVHVRPDGWHIDLVRQVIPYGRELPSQDGDYWLFYKSDWTGEHVYCFFAPVKGF